MANAPRIPLHSADDLYAKLKREHARLQAGWSTDDSFNFIVTAYHLYDDWARRAGTRAQQQRRNRLDPIAERLMHVLRDITNASKHWKLDAPNERKRVVGEVSSARIADWHSYFITGPQIYVTDVDGASLSMSTTRVSPWKYFAGSWRERTTRSRPTCAASSKRPFNR